jgi:serine/threonine-protein kinase HipA
MQLEVWLDRERVGTLAYDATHHRFSFAYTADWCARPAAYPLSPALPLAPTDQSPDEHSARVRRFFFHEATSCLTLIALSVPSKIASY